MWNDELPEGFAPDTPTRLCVESDLRIDGSFGHEWLVVTEAQLYVLSDGSEGLSVRLQFALSDLSDPKADELVGGGALEVKRGDERVELIRYSLGKSPRFAPAAQMLGKWLKGEEAHLPEDEETRCPRCGLPLEKGTKVCSGCVARSRVLRRLARYLLPLWKPSAVLCLISLSNTGLSLVPPYLQKPLMDQVLAPKGEPRPVSDRLWMLSALVLALLGARVMSAVIGTAQNWMSSWVGNNITHNIRTQLYRHLQYLSLSFFDKRQIGTVVSRVNQDTSQLQEFLVWGAQDLLIQVSTVVGIGIVLFLMNWQLALVVLVPAPILVFLALRFWKRMRFYWRRHWHRWSRVNAILSETLSGVRIVKAFAQERREITRFGTSSLDLAMTGVRAQRMGSILGSTMGLTIALGTFLVYYVGGRGVLFGQMSLGTMVAFMSYAGMFYGPVLNLAMVANWSSRWLTAAERVFEVLDSRPELDEADDAVHIGRVEGHVQFENVTFGYVPHNPVLKDISFDVAPGEMIGLVGKSGAGKSTTINLLCRFYDANQGEILIDDVPIGKVKLEDLRRQIGIVPQDTFLFSGTVADNISYAKPGATREEIIRAAKAANAHEFIAHKPDGYETLIGEGGGGISAGERQRIAIARAVLHDPRILILDEATSQVDVETENEIQEAIGRLVKGRTTFAIAHRLSTLKNADRLIVIKEGEIAEMGTHAELMAKEDGEFHRLVETYQQVSSVRAIER